MNSTVFIVGRNTDPTGAGGGSWDFQGVFASRFAAEAACRDCTYFVGPAVMDQALPHDTQSEWPGAYYPKA